MSHNRFVELDGVAFRAASPEDAEPHRAASSTRDDPGRFNTRSFGAFYLSCDPDTAIDELRRTVKRDGGRLIDADPCSLHFVRLRIHSAIDFTTAAARAAWSLSEDDLTSDDMRRCQEVAVAALDAGAEAMLWPSAAGSGRSLAIFVEHLCPESAIEIVDEISLDCAVLAALDRGELIREVASLPDWPQLRRKTPR